MECKLAKAYQKWFSLGGHILISGILMDNVLPERRTLSITMWTARRLSNWRELLLTLRVTDVDVEMPKDLGYY